MPPTTTSTCCMPASRSACSSAGTSDLQQQHTVKSDAHPKHTPAIQTEHGWAVPIVLPAHNQHNH